MDESLRLLLVLCLAVNDREEEAVRQGLREVATLLSDREGSRVARVLYGSLDAAGKGWLARIAGV